MHMPHSLHLPCTCSQLNAQRCCNCQQHQPTVRHPASACQDRVYAAAAERSASQRCNTTSMHQKIHISYIHAFAESAGSDTSG
jgi:hypothetical protein